MERHTRVLWAGRDTTVTPTGELGDSAVFHDAPLLKEIGFIQKLSAAHDHVLIINATGQLYSLGQLGEHMGVPESESQRLGLQCHHVASFGDTTITDVAAGVYMSAAVTAEGHLYVWGELPYLNNIAQFTPKRIIVEGVDGKGILMIAVNTRGTIAIVTDDNVLHRVSNIVESTLIPQYIKPKKMLYSDDGLKILSTDGKVYEDVNFTSPLEYPVKSGVALGISSAEGELLTLIGYPEWNMHSTHAHYPIDFRRAVFTMLVIAHVSSTKGPFYPEAHLHILPKELLLLIVAALAADYRAKGRRVFRQTKEDTIPTDDVEAIAAGYSHAALLTCDGDVYTTGSCRYGANGDVPDDQAEEGIYQQVPSLQHVKVSRLFAGDYITLALIDK